MTLALLWTESGCLLPGQVDATLRVADLIAEDCFLGPLADELATVGDTQRSALGLQEKKITNKLEWIL